MTQKSQEGAGVILKRRPSITPTQDKIHVGFAEIAIEELGYTDDETDFYGLSEAGCVDGGYKMVELVEQYYISREEHDRRVTELLEANNRTLELARSRRLGHERWQALTTGGRIRMQGSANVDTGVEGRTNDHGDTRMWVHFGAEFWSTYEIDEQFKEQDQIHHNWGVNALTALADDIIRREKESK